MVNKVPNQTPSEWIKIKIRAQKNTGLFALFLFYLNAQKRHRARMPFFDLQGWGGKGGGKGYGKDMWSMMGPMMMQQLG